MSRFGDFCEGVGNFFLGLFGCIFSVFSCCYSCLLFEVEKDIERERFFGDRVRQRHSRQYS
jgi:hypothetical protein